MDLLHIELAHEVDGFLRQHLTRDHDRETWRIGYHKTRRYQRRTISRSSINLLVAEPNVLATRRVVCGIEAATNITLRRTSAGILAERIVEATEVWQLGNV